MHTHLKKIGQFLALFNEIEAQSFVILRLMSQDALVKYASELDRFETRIRLIQALLRSSDIQERNEIESLFERALALGGYRNTLSHNPLRIRITQNSTDGSITETPAVVHAKKRERIPQVVEQLPSKLSEAESILRALNKITAEHTIMDSW